MKKSNSRDKMKSESQHKKSHSFHSEKEERKSDE